MTTTTDTTPTPDAVLAKLQAELEAVEILRVQAQREVDRHVARTNVLAHRINAIHVATTRLRGVAPLAPEQEWLDHLTAWRKVISDELLALPPRIRERAEIDRQQNLTSSLKLIDFDRPLDSIVTLAHARVGELMAAAGYATSGPDLRGPRGWRGSLVEVRERIKALTKQRTEAQAALDEALMDDADRAKRDAEDKALRDAFNSLHVKGSPDGTGYTVVDEDGDVRDLATLTPVQRRAFDRADAAFRQERQDVTDRQSRR